jgi:hypothetical protein
VWAKFIASQPVLLIPGANACVPWPKPVRPVAPFPVNQPFPPSVPALLLGGELDYLDIDSERSLKPLFPSGQFVAVANAGHVTTFWSSCARGIATRFLQTLRVTGTRCAASTTAPMGNPFGGATGRLQLRGVAAFPKILATAPTELARPTPRTDATAWDRRVAYVSWMAVTDAVYRIPRMTGTRGRGLRGGRYTISRPGTTTTMLTYYGMRFASDVAVTGSARLTAGNVLTARVFLSVGGHWVGWLSLRGVLWDPAHPLAKLTGTLHGRQVSVSMPTR